MKTISTQQMPACAGGYDFFGPVYNYGGNIHFVGSGESGSITVASPWAGWFATPQSWWFFWW